MSDYLAHYGVLGMKWGVRRYQPYGGGTYEPEHRGRFVGKKSTPSKSYTKNYEKALGAGYSEDEAKKYAKKKQVLKKVAITAAVVTVAAATAYVAYKHHEYSADKFIDPSVTLKRIAESKNGQMHDVFYAYMKKADHKNYAGMFAYQKYKAKPQSALYLKSIEQKGLKVASDKNALNVLKQVVAKERITNGNSKILEDMKKDAKIIANGHGFFSDKQRRVGEKALKSLEQGKIDRHVYDLVNMNIVAAKNSSDNYGKKFVDALKQAGYDAIIDVNDKRLSGYDSKAPVIVLNSAKTSVKSVSKMDSDTAKSLYNLVLKKEFRTGLAETGLIAGGATAAFTVGSSYVNKEFDISVNTKMIRAYKDEHPNTKLSNKEIIEQIYDTPISELSF